MELILLQDVERVGRKGEVIRVRDGFARNFLLPQSLAMPCTKANRQFVEEQKVRTAKRHDKEKVVAETKAVKLSSLKVIIESRAGDQDKLFGSVTAEDICEALKLEGQTFDKKQIHLKEPIRSLGAYPVVVEIYPQVKATVTVEVTRKA